MNELIKKHSNQKIFSAFDLIFLKNFKDLDSDQSNFLAYLFLVSKNGYLAMQIEDSNIYPSFDDLNLEFENEKKADEFKYSLINGSKTIQKDYFFHKADKIVKPLYKFENWYYLQKNFYLEDIVITKFKQLLTEPLSNKFSKELFFAFLEKLDRLTHDQKRAI